MFNRSTRLRWRRRLKRSRLQVEDTRQQAEDNIEKHVFKRLHRFSDVRRFIFSWTAMLLLLMVVTIMQTYSLSAYYQHLSAAPGGTFEEGIIGTYSNANPIYATSDVDSSVSKLIFPGLFKYNQNNQLVGDLAASWSTDAVGKVYNVTLKDNLKWQDGQPITAQDVVYTYQTIQNPDAQSPLLNNWQGVQVVATSSKTIKFTLSNPLSSFPYTLTNGIVPEHILSSTQPSQLKSSNFDTISPIGAGSFKMSAVQVLGNSPTNYHDVVELVSNPHYYEGESKLDRFVINAYVNQSDMVADFNNNNINAMVGLNSVPGKLSDDPNTYIYNIPLTAETMVFFRNTQPILSDVNVRKALIESIDEEKVINGLNYPVIPARGSLLPFQIGYNTKYLQYPTNITDANNVLNQDGWVLGKDGIRHKNNQPLTFNLFTQDNPDFDYVSSSLADQWRAVGVEVKVFKQQANDLQTTIATHSYDTLLYGISIGVDPDVFVYWDSSQAQPNSIPGLNLSQYKSSIADGSLEAGRTRTDPSLRAIKYQPFLQAWQSDAPALALYQPRYLYISKGPIYGFSPKMVNTGVDRYSNVANWEIREVKTTD